MTLEERVTALESLVGPLQEFVGMVNKNFIHNPGFGIAAVVEVPTVSEQVTVASE